jgi:hypothetical protein
MVLISFWNVSSTKDSINGIECTGAPKIYETHMLGVRKPRESDMDGFNHCGNQATYFVGWMENPNATNFTCYCKKIGTIFDTWPIIWYRCRTRKNTSKVGCSNKVENTYLLRQSTFHMKDLFILYSI